VLPPELTRARKREGKLTLSPLSPAERARASELCGQLLEATRAAIGREREEVEAGWSSVSVPAKERKLLAGLTHLIEARSEFTAPSGLEPELARREVFGLSARMRAALGPAEYLYRQQVLAQVAGELSVSVEELEQALYADLRSAQRLERCALTSPAALVADYELLQVQSVLLRAVRIEAEVRSARADAYRELFRKLKFRQLLFRIQPLAPDGYRLDIDGPLSLFGATTKYGLELALSLPALLACGQLKLKAELRWGKRREPLSFEQTYAGLPADSTEQGVRTEVLELKESLQGSTWRAELCDKLIDLTAQGGGVLVPDLQLTRRRPDGGTDTLLVEILGFWSRDAVFRRIEAAERGMSERVLFVVSSRLRVSEQLLDGVEAASLYVYKGKINSTALVRKADAMFR
jgi:hypothetical protein